MRNYKLMSIMAIAMLASSTSTGNNDITEEEIKENLERSKLRRKEKDKQLMKAKGLKEFIYHEYHDDGSLKKSHTIWARDEKNADRKAKNLGLI